MSEVNNPILGYADSYRLMVQMAEKECQPLVVSLWSVITDLELNMAPLMSAALSREASLIAENERLVTQVRLAGVAAEMTVHDAAGRAATDYMAVALDRDQLEARLEALRKSEAALREELAIVNREKNDVAYRANETAERLNSMTISKATMQNKLKQKLASTQKRLTAAEQRNAALLETAQGLTIQLHEAIGNTEHHENCIRDLAELQPTESGASHEPS